MQLPVYAMVFIAQKAGACPHIPVEVEVNGEVEPEPTGIVGIAGPATEVANNGKPAKKKGGRPKGSKNKKKGGRPRGRPRSSTKRAKPTSRSSTKKTSATC